MGIQNGNHECLMSNVEDPDTSGTKEIRMSNPAHQNLNKTSTRSGRITSVDGRDIYF